MPVVFLPVQRQVRNRDWVFYFFAGSLLMLGLTRVVFPGYLEEMFRDFSGAYRSQKKKGDGVARHGVASLWLNLIFLSNGSFFLYFLIQPSGPGADPREPWPWIGFWMLVLTGVYLFKYAVLLLAGWVTGKVQQAHDYLSIVFQVNRLAAILLLVAMLPLALSGDGDRVVVMPVVWAVLSMLLILRLVRSFGFLKHSLGLSPIQFLLLFLSFEALPLLLLQKALRDLYL